MSRKKNLDVARARKDDEFLTRYEDVDEELSRYDWGGLRVWCCCDDRSSAFLRWFWERGVDAVGSYMGEDGRGRIVEREKEIVMRGDGDFRSDECREILRGCDVVVSNVPFSLFREFMALMMSERKRFLVIGSNNAVCYREVFPLLMKGEIWLGRGRPNRFLRRDGGERGVACYWYGNVGERGSRRLDLREWDGRELERYENCDAVEVGRVRDVPVGYEGVMGVPIGWMWWMDDRFDVIGMAKRGFEGWRTKRMGGDEDGGCVLRGRCMYARVLIRWRGERGR